MLERRKLTRALAILAVFAVLLAVTLVALYLWLGPDVYIG
jgi:hypothetical protein